jgi:hyperosmotically inducible protein
MKSVRSTGSWLGALVLAGGLAFATPAVAADAPDPWITTKVKAALLMADDVDGLQINVDTVSGRVTLHGDVATDAEKAHAEELARKVEGVREVRNLIQVVPESRREQVAASDDAIRERVTRALQDDPALSGVSVESVNDGVVLLGGKVDSMTAHLSALEKARGVEGVRRVESEVESPDRLADEEIWRDAEGADTASSMRSAASDLWITSAAKVRLLAADVSALDVNVDTRDGAVTLFGTVGSEAERQRAAQEVEKVEGVTRVENELQVVPPARSAETERRDEQIAQDVERRVADRVRESDIDVQVADGVVRLSGTVPSQTDRLAALTAAKSSEGVRSVVGDLRVERN